MIVPEDATEPLETLDATGTLAHIVLGSDQPVVQALVVSFPVVVNHVFAKGSMQGRLPEKDHSFQALLLDGTDDPLRVGVEVGRAWWQAQRCGSCTLQQRSERFTELTVAAKISVRLRPICIIHAWLGCEVVPAR
jgi:hypothetical protein